MRACLQAPSTCWLRPDEIPQALQAVQPRCAPPHTHAGILSHAGILYLQVAAFLTQLIRRLQVLTTRCNIVHASELERAPCYEDVRLCHAITRLVASTHGVISDGNSHAAHTRRTSSLRILCNALRNASLANGIQSSRTACAHSNAVTPPHGVVHTSHRTNEPHGNPCAPRQWFSGMLLPHATPLAAPARACTSATLPPSPAELTICRPRRIVPAVTHTHQFSCAGSTAAVPPRVPHLKTS